MESNANQIVQELRAAYVLSLGAKCAEFAEAVHTRNFKTIIRLGHQLRGSGTSYGFAEVSDLGMRMEGAADNRRMSLLEPMIAEFQDIVNRMQVSAVMPEKS
jgi:HPt (histidine-containing phosphotransfer) domain-containing protein